MWPKVPVYCRAAWLEARGLEGWRVGGLANPPIFQSSNLLYFEPRASQLSSISQRLCLSQNSFAVFISKGLPSVCASITAFVLSERANSSCEQSMLYDGSATSTNTGTAPYCIIGATVVGKPVAAVITSSPLLILLSPSSGDVNAINARRLAEDPELTREQYFTPRKFANSSSNFAAY